MCADLLRCRLSVGSIAAVPLGGKMRTWLDDLAKWLDSPAGSIVAIGLPILVRALWPKLSSASRKRLAPRRRKGAKHQNHKHQDGVGGTVEPGVGL